MTFYCGHCGGSLAAPALTATAHDNCARQLELEPPRYCRQCKRRMVVQVLPGRWIARCAEHGETMVLTWTADYVSG
jgi:hypothetical protein